MVAPKPTASTSAISSGERGAVGIDEYELRDAERGGERRREPGEGGPRPSAHGERAQALAAQDAPQLGAERLRVRWREPRAIHAHHGRAPAAEPLHTPER